MSLWGPFLFSQPRHGIKVCQPGPAQLEVFRMFSNLLPPLLSPSAGALLHTAVTFPGKSQMGSLSTAETDPLVHILR